MKHAFWLLTLLLTVLLLASCGEGGNTVTLNVYNWGQYISDGSEGCADVNAMFEEYFEENFADGGVYATYYKQAGESYANSFKKEFKEDTIAKGLSQIKRDLLVACPVATISEDYIFGQLEDGEDAEEEETVESATTVNNNRVVVVTYGDRDANTFEKTAYKSIILNYNSYAVRVSYKNPLVENDEETLYTIPSGGYVVITYDHN